MNARILTIALGLSFFQLGHAIAQQNDDVLIAEDFETGANAPKGWRKGTRVKGVKFKYDKKQGFNGERSLSIEKSAQRYFPPTQWTRKLPHNSDKTGLKVTAQIKAKKMTKAIVDVTFLDEDRQPISHEWACYVGAKDANDPPANHDWEEYKGTIEIPDGTDQIEMALQIYGPGRVWIDDLKATYVDAGEPEGDADALDNMMEVAIGKTRGNYLYVAPAKELKSGNALLVVLPGGDGSADFHPFVNNIHANSLGKDFALAQPIAKKWTRSQRVVWPTEYSKTKRAKYTTEELIEAVVEDVGKKIELDSKRIFVLAWSSGGPAAYAALMQKKTSLAGGILAMSVFKPDQLPELENAQGRSVYIFHSPDDRTCPFWMAEEANEMLSDADVRNTLIEYDGGHGWRGNVFGNIKEGVLWLEESDE